MTTIIRIGKKILNAVYGLQCRKDTKKKVLYMSRESNKPGVDFELLSEEIAKRHPDYEQVMLCKRMGEGVLGKIEYLFHIMRQMKELSTAKVVILDTYNIPVSILKHRSNQTIAQIWHSIGTMKKNSLSILDKPEGHSSKIAKAMNMHENYDLIFCAGEGYREYLAESFGYAPSKLTIAALPRVDLLTDEKYCSEKKTEIINKYPQYTKGINIVYAPTFRKNTDEKEHFKQALAELKSAVSAYGDKYNLIVKAHPLSEVVSDCGEYSTAEMLCLADIVISDYSCVIYEAGLMKKPLYFYTYDYDEYMSRRSVYMDYQNEIPGPIHAKAKDILESIDANACDKNMVAQFVNRYVQLPNGSATENMVNIIWEEIINGR